MAEQKMITYVNGDILKSEFVGSRQVMLFAVDDSGEFGSGRLFESLTQIHPEIVENYESLTSLELGDVHIVYENLKRVVIFLIVINSENRNDINVAVLEKAMKKSADIVKDLNNPVVSLPEIGFGTDLPFSKVETLLKTYYSSKNIPCSVYHFKKPARTQKRQVFRAIQNERELSVSPLPEKRRRKPIKLVLESFEDGSSSSSSAESSEGDYEPSESEDEMVESSSSSGEEDEEDDIEESEEDSDELTWKTKRKHNRSNKNKQEKLPPPKMCVSSDDEEDNQEPLITESPSKYLGGGIVSLIDVPEDLIDEYRDFVLSMGSEVVEDDDGLSKATLSIIHSFELLEDVDKLEEFKKKFDVDCLHVTSDYLDDLIEKKTVLCINSYIL